MKLCFISVIYTFFSFIHFFNLLLSVLFSIKSYDLLHIKDFFSCNQLINSSLTFMSLCLRTLTKWKLGFLN